MLPSFTYKSHNKLSFGIDLEQLKQQTQKDSLEAEEMNRMMKKTYLMLIESITERKYLYPDNSKETVLASKVSGLSDPLFSLIASQLQTFSFYPEYITILDKKYLNPVSKGTTDRYLFILEDTLYKGVDTVFVISYRPRLHRNFDGLKGLLYINTFRYAMQYVTAEPAQGAEGSFDIKLRQSYELVNDSTWFPVQLNTELTYKYPQSDLRIFGNGRTYIKDIEINGKVHRRELGNTAYEILPNATERDTNFWESNRFEPLTEKDIETYRFIDSLSKRHNLNRYSGLFKTLAEGKIPWKCVDLDINKLFGYNNYHGWRIGLGIENNHKISDFFTAGGYVNYSFRKEQLRYGASLTLNIDRRNDCALKYQYTNDDLESGRPFISSLKQSNLLNDFRSYLIRMTDYTQEHKLSLKVRPQKYLLTDFALSRSETTPNYDYWFAVTDGQVNILQQDFSYFEFSLNTRFAYKEKFIRSGNYAYSSGTNFPVIYFTYTKGFTGEYLGDYSYNRLETSIEKDFYIKQVGKSSLLLQAGFIDASLPYGKSFNGNGSYEHLALYAAGTFNTMRMNEFLADRYAALFYRHNFGHLLFKTKKFKPEIIVSNACGIGTLKNSECHRNIHFSSWEKGYFESGIIIDDIIFTGFYGLGAACFYRYGYYSFPEFKNNFAAKLSLNFKI